MTHYHLQRWLDREYRPAPRWMYAAIVAGILVLGAFWFFSAPPALTPEQYGQAQAKADIQAGRLNLHALGGHDEWVKITWQLLHERYGVEIEQWTGLQPSPSQVAAASAYDKVMVAEICRRFGDDVFTRTKAEAKALDFAEFAREQAEAKSVTP